MKTWFTSDHHFGHKKILEYVFERHRVFETLENMHAEFIARHNSLVHPQDRVYFLGDIFFSDDEVSRRFTSLLHGRKTLIQGNHDRRSATRYRSFGFEEVHKHGLIVTAADKTVRLQHRPEVPAEDMISIDLIFHGHTHSNLRRIGNKIHVGVDAWSYYPVSEEQIKELVEEYEREVVAGPGAKLDAVPDAGM